MKLRYEKILRHTIFWGRDYECLLRRTILVCASCIIPMLYRADFRIKKREIKKGLLDALLKEIKLYWNYCCWFIALVLFFI